MASGTSTAGRRLKQGAISLGWALAGVLIAILLWEGVKLLGTVVTLPFETSNQAMPHVWSIAEGALAPEVRGSDTPVWVTVLRAAIYTLLIAFGGFIIGVAVGLLLAIVMQRFAFFERGLLPFVIASQTVPLIALAPLIVGIGNRISFGPFQWGQTQSIMFIAAYLAFFPLSVGALRGLQDRQVSVLGIWDHAQTQCRLAGERERIGERGAVVYHALAIDGHSEQLIGRVVPTLGHKQAVVRECEEGVVRRSARTRLELQSPDPRVGRVKADAVVRTITRISREPSRVEHIVGPGR
ncbi:MAG: hypothetical protein NWQ10_10405 [Candidatus Nanopelagicales bacterium]|jgi:ABC-type nitrate/sulfonate/bicarbonate transport system permease component|nr:hypothetical protein [Candidatus Nanopelagicales bacterium]MDP4976028.1 hypothetical protein [Candidatus Nanopelagicales bacterium]